MSHKSSKRNSELIESIKIRLLSMIVRKTGCLQAVCNQCEFIGNEREQSARLVCNESEQKEALFASRGDYVCKLLHIAVQYWRSRKVSQGALSETSGCMCLFPCLNS
jgi:hypothetical protein